MSFFTDELMKCTEEFEGRKCIGNAMYIPLGENNRLKLFFTTFGYADHYEGISISAVDKNNGVIDKNTIKFSDIWGKKQVSNQTSEIALPHIFGKMVIKLSGMCISQHQEIWNCLLIRLTIMPTFLWSRVWSCKSLLL